MLRSTARVLVIVMLFASGRLLACGLECLDEQPVPAQASCHKESAPVTSVNGGETHACLPESAEPRMTVAKLAADQLHLAAPLVARVVTIAPAAGSLSERYHALRSRFEAPHLPGVSVLRI